jgi:hypothetical protein
MTSESVKSVSVAALHIAPSVAEALQCQEAGDGQLEASGISRAARAAVAAWAAAVNGDDSALTEMAGSDARYWLLLPARLGWRVAPGPTVTEIGIWGLDADADLARMRIQFRFAGPPGIAGQSCRRAAVQNWRQLRRAR